MNDFDIAELANWLKANKEDWQRLQKYFDMRIEEIGNEVIEYIEELTKDQLCVIRGKLEALKEVRELSSTLT